MQPRKQASATATEMGEAYRKITPKQSGGMKKLLRRVMMMHYSS